MRFRDIIKKTILDLEKIGFEALFPNIDCSDENKDMANTPEEKLNFAQDHYKAIANADVIYFITPKGYMGTSVKLELGYALALQKQIYFSQPTTDMALDCYCKKIIPLENLSLFLEELKF